MERTDDEWIRYPQFVKSAVDAARRYRKVSVRRARGRTEELIADADGSDKATFLRAVSGRLQAIEAAFDQDEELFDKLFGPPGGRPVIGGALDPAARGELLKRESALYAKDLGELSQEFRGRLQRAEVQLAAQEGRAFAA